ncbi:hypothetical protein FSP39_023736 [Pinctada imbricata]|uniref:Uncharacterized protein n=1 Tax=Pinctada imbricata TaxID=66713 RepID=A0AA89C4E3_PINIB|nr:hypothetical protein FSP39_023736 [Pinctada imbricata]
MVFSVTEFLKSPTVDEFESLKKDDLIGLGLHLKLDVKSSMRKQEIRNIVAKELLAKEIFSSYDFPVEPVSSETKMSKFEFELEKMKIQLQFEKEEKGRQFQFEKEEKERQFQIEKEEKERQFQIEREEKERQFEKEEKKSQLEREKQERMHERELQFELEKLKLEKGAKENPVPSPVKSEFDAAKNIRLVPKFHEKSVDKYFPHFEKIAANLKWPRDFWPTLLQSVLIGKAAEVYSALSIAESSDYDKVKDTILRAYQLVPEAYRQKFRKYKKFENQTYVEFAREKEDLFDQWFRSKKIPNSFDNLRQIILIEEFKECVHQDLRTHLEDKNVKTLEEAAVLSDTYALTHKKNFVSKTQSSDSAKTSNFPKKNLQESQSSISSQSPSQGGSTSGPRSERSEASPGGVELGVIDVPLHEIYLKSDLITGPVIVGVRPTLPVQGVSLLLGNDLAGGKVVADPIVCEKITSDVVSDDEDDDLYPACAVTRAMARNRLKEAESTSALNEDHPSKNIDLSDTFMSTIDDSVPETSVRLHVDKSPTVPSDDSYPPLDRGTDALSREQLLSEQTKDPEIIRLSRRALPQEEADKVGECFYIQDGILMRKWRPPDAPPNDVWRVVHQIVVPVAYRGDIMSLAHDTPMADHLGVNKTYNRILSHFYWPKLRKDVSEFCKSCHSCQMVGKPNQVIPPAPLQPIPAFEEPFSRVLVDCVGPLPRTRSGNQYLLTIMCTSTRFPEAMPLRNIKAKTIVKALTKFFSFVGAPKAIQSDQGSNFMSGLFQQVMHELGIRQYKSSAYHPESQGALERFHQTLKTMMKTYCHQYGKDWDEGVHLVLFAAREAVQESLGFSPFELVFGHTVRGPLKLLKEKWLTETSDLNLLDYVSNFKEKLYNACKLFQENDDGVDRVVSPCQDDPRQNCWAYEDVKCIEKYEPWSRKHCPYRCGYCPDPGRNSTVTTAPQSTTQSTVTTHKPVQQQTTLPTLPTGAACQDQLTNCDDFSAESCQGLFKTWALLNCPRRCGYCSGGIDECKDYEDCGRLPDDLCKNSAYATLVKTSCRKYCGLCTVKATTQQPVVTKVPVATVTSPQNYTDQPPVAIATDVVIDYPDTTATLNASLSHDDIGISSYKWEYMGNLNADIRGLYTDTVQLYDLEVGTYEFKLTITDTIGQTDTIKIKVEVVRANNTCELPLDEGVCNAYLPRFYYNQTTQTCESYVYGGCFGNSNNFVTEQQCREFCLVCNKNFDIPVPECCGPICACNHTVEGYVTDASNNATPMANVSVYVSGCYCHPFAFSDDKGHYVMSGLCQDDNTLRFETEGYRSHLETPKYMGNGQYQASAPMEPSSKGPMVTPLNPGNSGTSSSAPQANSNADGQNAMVNPGNVLG